MGLGALLLGAATMGLRAAAQPEEQVIKILARKFTYSPNKLTLKKGVPVVLELTTADVLMGFSVPDFDIRADIIPGQVARVRLVPDKTGTFELPLRHFLRHRARDHERDNHRRRVTCSVLSSTCPTLGDVCSLIACDARWGTTRRPPPRFSRPCTRRNI